jgi:hypothetical protein
MHAHQGLNRLDDPLGVANEIAPGLVEQHGMGARKRFQARRPSPGMPRRAAWATGDEGDRRRQNQRTRRRRYKHGQTADQIDRDQLGDEGKCERNGEENQRITIGQPQQTAPWRSARRSRTMSA